MRKKTSPLRIAIVGSRGIPAGYGGFETFAEEIAMHLHDMYGYTVTVVCDYNQQITNNAICEYHGVQIRYSNFSKSNNAILYYRDSIRKVLEDHDIIYSCGPAGGLFGLHVRRKGKIMITNPDGLNSLRTKWSLPVKVAFRAFEFAASRFSDLVICDSQAIEEYIQKSYRNVHTHVIEYGAYINPHLQSDESSKTVLAEYGLKSGEYHLVVSRLEPENNLEIIIRGYQFESRKWPLIVVGNLKQTDFVKHLQKLANNRVHFVDGIYDKDKLSIIRAHAASYIHGHSVGGTNPSLLEAMASRNICICHDNPFNREVVRDHGLYFSNVKTLNECIDNLERAPEEFVDMRNDSLLRIQDYYNWKNMAEKYHKVFSDFYSTKK